MNIKLINITVKEKSCTIENINIKYLVYQQTYYFLFDTSVEEFIVETFVEKNNPFVYASSFEGLELKIKNNIERYKKYCS